MEDVREDERAIAVVAVGGNALILDDKHKTVPDQFRFHTLAWNPARLEPQARP